jgi:microcompartment protein CcmL/EutN
MPELRMALGFIETQGLPAAMTAADAAAKAANIRILGRENTRGEGRITVKVIGDVGAVRASLDAAKAASEKVLSVRGVLVLPRPAPGIGNTLAWNEETLGAAEWLQERIPAALSTPPCTPETDPPVPETLQAACGIDETLRVTPPEDSGRSGSTSAAPAIAETEECGPERSAAESPEMPEMPEQQDTTEKRTGVSPSGDTTASSCESEGLRKRRKRRF